MRAPLSLWLYGVLTHWAQPLLRRKLQRRAKAEPLYGQFVEERFGHYTEAAHHDWIWVHAVSLGETRTAGILIKALRENFPGMKLLLTHGTATGREEGQKLLQEGDLQVWQPWDSPHVVARFFKAFKPRLGLIMETEVWPHWVHQAKLHNVPLVLVNARMSDKSMRQALRWPSLMCPAYAGLRAVLPQTQDDAHRLTQLGAHVPCVLGNLKFDAKPDASQMNVAQHWRSQLSRPVLMLASSREGEELRWLDAWQHHCQTHASPPVQWLIVPRHPQRVNEVEQLIQSRGFQVARRSSWGLDGPVHLTPSGSENSDVPCVWLGDSLGEMALYYSLADAALLGGSFEKLGGQNLIEAAACGCPVVMGPHTFNFTEAAQAAEDADAALRAADMQQAVEKAVALVLDDRQHSYHAEKAQWFAQQHGGATQRTVLAVREQLNQIKDSKAR